MKIKSVIYSLISIFVLFYFSCSDVAFETMIDFSLTKDDLQTYLARQGKDNALQENDEELTITATLYDEKDKEIAVVSQDFSLEEKEYRIQFEKIPVGQQVKAFISIVLNDCILAQLSSDYVTVKEGNTLIPLRWDAITTATYKIEHYQQNIADDAYTVYATEELTGSIGGQTTAESKTYAGFTLQEFSQQTIAEDNSTIVKIYYDRNVVTLTFDLAGGSLGENQTTNTLSGKYGATIEQPENPTKEGYIFGGWDKALPETFPSENETYTAQWRDINQVAAVTFNIPAGNVSMDTIITLSCETAGATIWYKIGEEEGNYTEYTENSSIQITEGTTIFAYAICTGMKNSNTTSATYCLYQYSLKFDTNGGTDIDSTSSYADGSTMKLEFTTTKAGYVFAGWYISDDYSGESVTDVTFSLEMEGLDENTNTVTLYAKWTPVVYTITYKLNAGEDPAEPENPNVISYTIETETITLQNPTRNGYDFVGWYTDEDYTSQITQIEKGSTGDITLYAKWEEKYSFELGDQDDTPNEIDSGTAEYDSTTKTITVTNPGNSDSVWSYYIKSTNINFEKDKNYKISLELKTERDTVVGIQAGNTDMFFTVGVDWTLCTLETGYIQQELSDAKNCITIGTGLSEKVSYRSLNITEITENSLPALVFNVTKQGIENYLTQENKPSNIIKVEKNNGNTGYNITINTPLTSEGNAVTSEDSKVYYYNNDVTLHLRGYSPDTLGMAKASYTISNNDNLETSILIQPESNTMLAWNNAVKKVSDYNTDGLVFEYFPNYTTEENIMVDVISKSSTVPSSNSTSFEIKEFKIESVTTHDKIFVMGYNDCWQQLSQDSQITINLSSGDTSIDVLMLDSKLWNGKEITSWDTITRIKKLQVPENLTLNYDVNEENITLTNTGSDTLTCCFSLNDDYVVEITESKSSTGEETEGNEETTEPDGTEQNPFTTWDSLATKIATIGNSSTDTTEIYISGEMTASSTITVSSPVKITAANAVTITRGAIDENGTGFQGAFFDVSLSLELAGTEFHIITLDGGNANESSISAECPLIATIGALTLENCILQNNTNTSSYGGAIYAYQQDEDAGAYTVIINNCAFKNNSVTNSVSNYEAAGGAIALYGTSITSEIRNCTFNGNSAVNSGGALYIYGNGTNNSNNTHTFSTCTFTGNSATEANNTLTLYQGNFILESLIFETSETSTDNYSDVYTYNAVSTSVSLQGESTINTLRVCKKDDCYPTITLTDDFSSDVINLVLKPESCSISEGDKIITCSDNNTLTDAQINYFSVTDTDGNAYFLNSNGTISETSSTGEATEGAVSVATWQGLKEAIEGIESSDYTADSPYVIAIDSDISTDLGSETTASTITVDSHIKLIAAADYSITRTSDYASVNLFTVSENASLTIGDTNSTGTLTLDGGGSNATSVEATKSLINVSSGGTLVLNEKSVLQNNYVKNSTHGGAVYSNGGTIKVYGGIVKNNSINTKSKYGCGIYLTSGVFEMTSGTFENNVGSVESGSMYGGALYLSDSTITITGATFKENVVNTGTSCYGGALYITGVGTSESPVTISNCKFENNSAYQRGGAIYTGGESFVNITNCTFSSNSVTSDTGNGGAIYVGNTSGTVSIDNCSFSENTANSVLSTIYLEATSDVTVTVDDETLSAGTSWSPSSD